MTDACGRTFDGTPEPEDASPASAGGSPPSGVLRDSSNSRLSARALPWYPVPASGPAMHHASSTSSQPRREDEFPGTPVDFSPALGGSGRRMSHLGSTSSNIDQLAVGGGGVSPVACVAVSRGGRSPSSSSSAAGSPILVARTHAYSTDQDENVTLVRFAGYETEDEIIHRLAADAVDGGYWWIPSSADYVTAQQCHERLQRQQEEELARAQLQGAAMGPGQGPARRKKMRKTRQDALDGSASATAVPAHDGGDGDDGDDAEGSEATADTAGSCEDAEWEDDPDAYGDDGDDWDSLDEAEQAWIEEQLRPRDNPEGFFF